MNAYLLRLPLADMHLPPMQIEILGLRAWCLDVSIHSGFPRPEHVLVTLNLGCRGQHRGVAAGLGAMSLGGDVLFERETGAKKYPVAPRSVCESERKRTLSTVQGRSAKLVLLSKKKDRNAHPTENIKVERQ